MRRWTSLIACPVLRSNHCRLRSLGCPAKLDDEITGEVLRFDFTAFLLPEPDQGGFIAAHDDPGVRAADEGAAAYCGGLFQSNAFHGILHTSDSK
jgi:hypothetical protein